MGNKIKDGNKWEIIKKVLKRKRQTIIWGRKQREGDYKKKVNMEVNKIAISRGFKVFSAPFTFINDDNFKIIL